MPNYVDHKKIFTGLLLSILALIAYIQITYDATLPPFSTSLSSESRILLPEKILPYISLGFNNFLADIYWIRSIQDLVTWAGKDPYYLNYFKNISALDPRFEYPYLFSILAIPQSETRNKDITPLNNVAEVAKRGITAIPTSWQIPFYLGTQYYIFTKQYEPAESYLAIAASRQGAPDGVYLVYSTFVGKNVVRTKNILNNTKQEINETTRQLVKVIFDNTDNQTTKDLVAKGYKVEAIRQMLEKGIIAYKQKFERYPNSVEEMVNAHFIQLPDGFSNEFIVSISKNNGEFTVTAR